MLTVVDKEIFVPAVTAAVQLIDVKFPQPPVKTSTFGLFVVVNVAPELIVGIEIIVEVDVATNVYQISNVEAAVTVPQLPLISPSVAAEVASFKFPVVLLQVAAGVNTVAVAQVLFAACE